MKAKKSTTVQMFGVFAPFVLMIIVGISFLVGALYWGSTLGVWVASVTTVVASFFIVWLWPEIIETVDPLNSENEILAYTILAAYGTFASCVTTGAFQSAPWYVATIVLILAILFSAVLSGISLKSWTLILRLPFWVHSFWE